MNKKTLLVGDIGGTNARFALADTKAPGFSQEQTFDCADFPTVEAAIIQYLEQVGASSPDVICVAAAGPVVDRQIRLTNNQWVVTASEMGSAFGTNAIGLMNDFEAIAWSIPVLAESDCLPIGRLEGARLDKSTFAVGAIGPGTGLGKVGLVKRGNELITLSGEAGHTGFAPETQQQVDILSVLRGRYDRVSTEHVVSGPGIENIYWALTKIGGEEEQLDAASIFGRAEEDGQSIAGQAVQMFFEILGQVAGDLAMCLGARDGMYVAGGIAQRYPDMLAGSLFRSGFENKGPNSEHMKTIPTRLITHPQPGLLGASYIAREMATSS